MPDQIIIASVTKMSRGLCIGGYVLSRGWSHANLQIDAVRSVRLVPAGELWHPNTNQWRPGQIITAEISERPNKVPPHTEDATMHKWSQHGCRALLGHTATEVCACLGGAQPQSFPLILKEIALKQAFRGSVSGVFGGKITRKANGRAVVLSPDLGFSTQWWIPEWVHTSFDTGCLPIRITTSQYQGAAILEAAEDNVGSSGQALAKWTFKYVGVNPICRRKIQECCRNPGTTLLLRLSLARWWAAPSDTEKLCYGDLSSAWAFSDELRGFEPLDCANAVDGQCACELLPAYSDWLEFWGEGSDLPF